MSETEELNVGSGKKCSSCGGTVAAGRKTCQNCGHSFSATAEELSERVTALEELVVAIGRQELGDSPGHDFRGNQYSGGKGGGKDSGPPKIKAEPHSLGKAAQSNDREAKRVSAQRAKEGAAKTGKFGPVPSIGDKVKVPNFRNAGHLTGEVVGKAHVSTSPENKGEQYWDVKMDNGAVHQVQQSEINAPATTKEQAASNNAWLNKERGRD